MIRRTTKESTAPDDLEGQPWLNTIAAWAEYAMRNSFGFDGTTLLFVDPMARAHRCLT
jgi:hypothetical protein